MGIVKSKYNLLALLKKWEIEDPSGIEYRTYRDEKKDVTVHKVKGDYFVESGFATIGPMTKRQLLMISQKSTVLKFTKPSGPTLKNNGERLVNDQITEAFKEVAKSHATMFPKFKRKSKYFFKKPFMFHNKCVKDENFNAQKHQEATLKVEELDHSQNLDVLKNIDNIFENRLSQEVTLSQSRPETVQFDDTVPIITQSEKSFQLHVKKTKKKAIKKKSKKKSKKKLVKCVEINNAGDTKKIINAKKILNQGDVPNQEVVLKKILTEIDEDKVVTNKEHKLKKETTNPKSVINDTNCQEFRLSKPREKKHRKMTRTNTHMSSYQTRITPIFYRGSFCSLCHLRKAKIYSDNPNANTKEVHKCEATIVSKRTKKIKKLKDKPIKRQQDHSVISDKSTATNTTNQMTITQTKEFKLSKTLHKKTPKRKPMRNCKNLIQTYGGGDSNMSSAALVTLNNTISEPISSVVGFTEPIVNEKFRYIAFSKFEPLEWRRIKSIVKRLRIGFEERYNCSVNLSDHQVNYRGNKYFLLTVEGSNKIAVIKCRNCLPIQLRKSLIVQEDNSRESDKALQEKWNVYTPYNMKLGSISEDKRGIKLSY